MMARSVSSANPINRRHASTALALLLEFLTEFQRLDVESAIDLADAKRLQSLAHRFANRAPWDRAGAGNNCRLRPEAISALGRFAKRIMDFLVASITILLLWPLMLVIAVAVKLESRGPVIYRSLRVGEGGATFVFYKLRTMIPGAHRLRKKLFHLNQRRGPFFKMADDPRVTRLGRFLRKYSLDELPQLWNVLKGDMSLVGPRPHPLEDVAWYKPGHEERLEVTPGITGLWQVTARANPSFETCMLLDVGYIRNWSLLLDLKILLRTIPAVLAGEGQ
jgi:lipopolysaccharide/colanic/teichoic acid biosynthesis glycosyltransferase